MGMLVLACYITSESTGSSTFITNDGRIKHVSELRTLVLEELES